MSNILVIDDEEIMREILETLLAREGYDVKLAASGEEGLELARAIPFDAALVDIMMPGINGIETLDELRRIDEDLAVIIITGRSSSIFFSSSSACTPFMPGSMTSTIAASNGSARASSSPSAPDEATRTS